MSFVLDASIAASWAFSDESHPTASRALSLLRTEEALVPPIWWFEIRNVLIGNERRKRLTAALTSDFLQKLSRLPIHIEPLPENGDLLALARAHALTVYDAAYLELAKRSLSPLATLDADLIRAARAEGIILIASDGRSAGKPPGKSGRR